MADRNILRRVRYAKYILRNGMELTVPASDLISVLNIPSEIDPFTTNDVAQAYPLGTKLVYGERAYRYAGAGGTAFVVGSLYQSVVPLAGHIDEVIGSPAIGATVIDFTPNTVTTDDMALNEFSDGYINIVDEVGEAYLYSIASHPAIVGGVLGVLTLRDPIVIVPAAGATGSILHNKFAVNIVHPSPPTAGVTGVAVGVVTANQFGWLQTAGPASVLTDTTLIIADLVVPAATDIGAVMASAAFETDGPMIGHVLLVGANLEHSIIDLKLESA